jgi:hypothetical protein
MNIAYHLRLAAFAVVVTAATLTASVARAEEAPLFGLSVEAHAAPVMDRSVIDLETGRARGGSRPLFGLSTVLNWDGLALGAVLDGMPGIFGDGRMAVGALGGWQPRIGSQLYQLLAEIGQERFSDVGGNLLSTPSTKETWLPYVGARLGMTQTFGRNNPFELGAWLFFRRNIGEATVANTSGDWFGGEDTITEYRVGGYSAGLALRLGVRFDQKRRPNDSTVDVQYEPVKS